jgi:acetyl-CoA acetyltransferase
MTVAGRVAITGLGVAGLTRSESPSASSLACNAITAAIADAGLTRDQIDGLIVTRSGASSESELGLDLQHQAVLKNLALLQVPFGEGTSSIQAIQIAALAIMSGMVKHVVCVFGDAPVHPGKQTRESFGRIKSVRGLRGLRYSAGLFGGAGYYAMAARRHMHLFGMKSEDLGAVAVAARQWACKNPAAIFREPLSMQDYLRSRWIVEPLRLFDCAIPVNGAIAVIVSPADVGKDMAQPPVYLQAMAQGHCGTPDQRGAENDVSGAALAKDRLLLQAKISVSDVDICQFYDAFTFMTVAALEDYGFCKKGEGGSFVSSGAIGPGGTLPTNTGGGHLSGFYLQGMTPIAEAVVQARGQAGERQCARNNVILVTNDGGRFDYHASLILSPHQSLR